MKSVFLIIFILSSKSYTLETIHLKFIPPENYNRVLFSQNSFANYIQSLPLKDDNKILKHDGQLAKQKRWNSLAVISMPLMFKDNLEQCSDFCMRFWANFHKKQNRLNQLILFNYMGENKPFISSGLSYNKFLRKSFAFSNSYSLKRALKKVDSNKLIPGDLIIQSRGHKLGHVSMIMDLAINSKKQRLYLIGFSAIPAQEFHIESAKGFSQFNEWFTIEAFQKYLASKIKRGKPSFRRFGLK
ncbi:MAG: hypothetical protein COB02_08265 [Candidatus Cloacimonadota bacterium]|nr:MAG: hypothetical protein COB02_08265 [Candidatus Cloacimonadota bacterium]